MSDLESKETQVHVSFPKKSILFSYVYGECAQHCHCYWNNGVSGLKLGP